MNYVSQILIAVIFFALAVYVIPQILERFSSKNLGILELNIDRAEPGRQVTRLMFRDVVIPGEEKPVEELYVNMPNPMYAKMRERKQFSVSIRLSKGKFIRGKFHSLIK